MRICFPIEGLDGLDSMVCENFGSVPGFVVADTASKDVEEIRDPDSNDIEGSICQHLLAIGVHEIDTFVVGGIGADQLVELMDQGIKVYRSTHDTVGQNIVLLLNKKLPQFNANLGCGACVGKKFVKLATGS